MIVRVKDDVREVTQDHINWFLIKRDSSTLTPSLMVRDKIVVHSMGIIKAIGIKFPAFELINYVSWQPLLVISREGYQNRK